MPHPLQREGAWWLADEAAAHNTFALAYRWRDILTVTAQTEYFLWQVKSNWIMRFLKVPCTKPQMLNGVSPDPSLWRGCGMWDSSMCSYIRSVRSGGGLWIYRVYGQCKSRIDTNWVMWPTCTMATDFLNCFYTAANQLATLPVPLHSPSTRASKTLATKLGRCTLTTPYLLHLTRSSYH